MKTLFVNRNIIASIFAVMLLIYGVQGISYAQGVADPVAEFADASLAEIVRGTLRLGRGDTGDILRIPKAELVKLTRLDASWRELERYGHLPSILDLTGLEHATELRELYLGDNRVSDITPLAQLTQLRELDLTRNQDVSDITPLAQLTQLRKLHLTGNQISDITPLAQLTQLQTLTLSANNIIDITPLAQLTQLRTLSVRGNNIIDIAPLAQLTQLQTLSLGGNNIIDLAPLAQLTQLQTLYLDNNSIIDIAPLAQLTQLTWLSLLGNNISDITPLSPLTLLTTVFLSINQIRDISPIAQLKRLTSLHISRNKIRDITPLAQVKSLVKVNLSDNEIRDVTPLAQLADASLTELDLQNNQIRDVSPLAALVYLEELSLGGNPITDTFPLSSILDENPDLDIDIEVVREEGGPTLTLSSPQPLTGTTLDGSVVTLKLSNGVFIYGTLDIQDDITISGITGVTFDWYDIEQVSNTEVRIKLTFNGEINKNTTLTFTVGPGAIENYNLSAFTAEIPVSAGTEPVGTDAATVDAMVSISPASVASPAIGEQLEISLNITDGEAVAGYQATVQFDDTALRYVSGANSDFLPAGAFFVDPKVEGNLVKLNAASFAGESNGDGTLATLTFEVIAVKASTLTLSDVLLTNSAAETFVPRIENAAITESTGLKGDVNGDGIVNIADLVLVAGALGETGQHAADVNGDSVVNIADLVLVAGALGNSAAAPSLHPYILEMLTATEVKQWLSQAQRLGITDATSQRGILFLQQLLVSLTPKKTALLANYPNPFNPETWIPYHLAKDAEVTLHIYAVNGTLVRTLALGHQAAGMYQNRSRAAYWDGKNAFGEKVASGVYFYTFTAGDFSATRKMLIRK